MDLSEFLAARLGEDEAAAKAWAESSKQSPLGDLLTNPGPARMLREVEAKRKILVGRWGGPDHEDMWDHHVRLLAAVWCDHPDYHETWRP